jgi:hypothetical protein
MATLINVFMLAHEGGQKIDDPGNARQARKVAILLLSWACFNAIQAYTN